MQPLQKIASKSSYSRKCLQKAATPENVFRRQPFQKISSGGSYSRKRVKKQLVKKIVQQPDSFYK
ncbi:hypothetical protein TSAR_010058 [Trichomalopsis sarcophagae]|uniref:Uncharacterized protein n=1 Tax=Trichomalopsis sarcophagae TaxID=543379 RepID=A0A232EU13_9HYME|nr:hypothetical protein TSAR_010058 [Trichomalopsis sarcophagae]